MTTEKSIRPEDYQTIPSLINATCFYLKCDMDIDFFASPL